MNTITYVAAMAAPIAQGVRISNSKELEEILVIPGGLEALGPDTEPR